MGQTPLEEIRRLNRALEQRVADRTAELTEKVGALESARAALARSEALYRNVVNNVSEGIMIVQDACAVFANPRVSEISGYPLDELIARPFAELIHPADRDAAQERYRRRMRGERVDPRVSFRLVHKCGRAIWIELSVVMTEWQGRPATLSFMTDMTGRKRAEEALRRSEESYRNVIENMSEGLFVAQGPRIVLANPSAVRLAGYTLDELHDLDFINAVIHADDREMVVDRYRRRLAGEPVDPHYAFRIVCKDGTVKWVEISAVRIDWQGGPATLSFLFDVTERRRLEASLERTLEERGAILENARVGITYVVGRTFQWVNRAFAEMVGCDPREPVGMSTRMFYPDEASWARVGSEAYPRLAEGGTYSTEVQGRRKDGTLFWAQIHGGSVEPEHPERGTIWSVVDVTERRRAQEDMRRALEKQRELAELKSRFVSMTSHEFRTPLAAIQSSAELLRDYSQRLPADERAELLGMIATSVRRMGGMLDNVLAIGRADAERLEFNPQPVDLAVFCAALVEEARRAAEGPASAEVRLRIEGDGIRVRADEKLLRHILGNLLGNALKYSPGGGVVRFDVARRGAAVEFAVADSGIGIPAEDLPHLFEPFHRARNIGSIAGTGLGLAIVKRCVDLHGGTIAVESRVGAGTRAVVTLPCG